MMMMMMMVVVVMMLVVVVMMMIMMWLQLLIYRSRCARARACVCVTFASIFIPLLAFALPP